MTLLHSFEEADASRLRERATGLLALAIRARENGDIDVGNDIALLASEAFNQADELERRRMAKNWLTRAAVTTLPYETPLRAYIRQYSV